jgi:enterochelin esterase-like enzyme
MQKNIFVLFTMTLGSALLAPAQVQTEIPPVEPSAKPVRVEQIKIHGASLEGNLEDEEVDRVALVFLPASYATAKSRRYPVVYALHGYFIGAEQWSKEIHVPQTIEGAFAKGAQEMIVVLPDSKTVYNGSMYSSSVTTGDFENYVARDVVGYMDAHYRTIPKRTSRGLSPCCMSARGAGGGRGGPGGGRGPNMEAAVAEAKSPAEAAKLPGLGTQLAVAAAWSPNPKKPPLYLDMPFGDAQQEVLNKWAANAPLVFVHQYIGNLKQYKAIAMDVGDQDGLRVDAGKLHEILDSYGIANGFEVYPGTHTSAVAVRFQNYVMPFFAKNLCSGKDCK